MNVRDWVLLEYEQLGEGVTTSGNLCPQCKGGSTGEGTFSVSRRDGVLLWHCHRASCGLSGSSSRHRGSGEPSTRSVDVRGTVGRDYIRTSSALPEHIASILSERYGLGPRHFARWGIGWAEAESRVVVPVLTPQGEPAGAVLRSVTGAVPKSLTHTESAAMAWYPRPGNKHIIIVEDQLSAIRAADYVNAVALLGTNLNEDRLYEIRDAGFREAMLALDRDAYPLSVRYAARFRGIVRLNLVRLQADIKNQSEAQLNELFSGLK